MHIQCRAVQTHGSLWLMGIANLDDAKSLGNFFREQGLAAYNGGKHLVIRRCCTPRPLFRRAAIKSWLQIGDTRIDGEADKLAEYLRNLEEEKQLMDVGESRWVLSPEAKDCLDEQE